MNPSAFKICAIATFIFEEGITTCLWFTMLAFRIRVSISAIGSVVILLLPWSLLQAPAMQFNKSLDSMSCTQNHASLSQNRLMEYPVPLTAGLQNFVVSNHRRLDFFC